MTHNFQVFDPARADPTPKVTVESNGSIRMNAAAHRLIDRAAHVELLFDRDQRFLALKPTHAENPNGYASTTGIVSIRALLRHCER